MAKKNEWFEVDKAGLAQVARRRGSAFLPLELLGNAWDTDATDVLVEFEHVSRGLAHIRVTDNDPRGFEDLSASYTLYGRTSRRGDPRKRGRFCIGEKEVLSLCKSAVIETVTGTVSFKADGQRRVKRTVGLERGTIFQGDVYMNKDEVAEALEVLFTVIQPEGVHTIINGETLSILERVGEFSATLPTELADDEGNMRRTRRKTRVVLYEVEEGDTPRLYELGIPVCDLPDDKWHVDVQQKVPLPRDRDSVSPSYLQALRVEIVNNFHEELEDDDAGAAWVRAATSDENIEAEAFDKVIHKRHGDDIASWSVQDPEANSRGVSEGFSVLAGGSLSSGEWGNAKRFETMEPSSVLFPTSKAIFSADGDDIRVKNLTSEMTAIIAYTKRVGEALLGFEPEVDIVRDPQNYGACYGSKHLRFNLRRLGRAWFQAFPDNLEKVTDLVIHELAHEFESDHLSEGYYNACTRLGAKLVMIALERPEIFPVEFKEA
ncbi:hypothetical protein LCGC14_0163010 [marine sediment metagenome]|uniref:Uncharacterized protein n=1 Tax=marine sediment metagenome TaxID=412755 RepID=A0A0F9VA57_9ZZZZ